MTTTRRLAATAAAAALVSGAVLVGAAGQAAADELIPAYHTTYYSDASQQTVVGRLIPSCRVFPYVYVQYRLVGSQSPHGVDELAYYCGPNGPEPI